MSVRFRLLEPIETVGQLVELQGRLDGVRQINRFYACFGFPEHSAQCHGPVAVDLDFEPKRSEDGLTKLILIFEHVYQVNARIGA